MELGFFCKKGKVEDKNSGVAGCAEQSNRFGEKARFPQANRKPGHSGIEGKRFGEEAEPRGKKH